MPARKLLCVPIALAVVCLAGLVGCGGGPASTSLHGMPIAGHVRSGQQPVSGARVQLYAAGGSGAGSGATDLLATRLITTDVDGAFDVPGDYACPSAGTQVYLVARGGSPGLPAGETNPALVLMTALGSCGALSGGTDVAINEVTSAAAAWGLAQFLGAGAEVGASATNATGLADAFAAAANLADARSGVAPGGSLPSGSVTETAKLNTLADALAACSGSSGAAACAPLFSAATSAGFTPANTLDAAWNIVRNPGTNVAAVFSAAPTQGPYQPSLSAAPHDWTMSITYSGGGLNVPGGVAIDSAGNVEVANYFGGALSKFSPAGVAAAAAGIAGEGLNESYGVAVDAADNVWVTNEQSVSAAGNSRHGSVSEFSVAGAELSGYGYTGGGVYYPIAVAADTTGAIWIANYGDSSATLLNEDGTAVSGSGGYAAGALPFVSEVAVDAGHYAWFAVQGGAARVTPAGVVTNYSCCRGPAGIAVDQSGSVWVADYTASAVVKLNAQGAVTGRTTIAGGSGGPQAIAIDGAGSVWVGNYYGDSVVQLNGTSAAVTSPAAGYGMDAPLHEPYGIAIDASGDIWISNSGADTLTEFVGLAAPVKTPTLGPPVQP